MIFCYQNASNYYRITQEILSKSGYQNVIISKFVDGVKTNLATTSVTTTEEEYEGFEVYLSDTDIEVRLFRNTDFSGEPITTLTAEDSTFTNGSVGIVMMSAHGTSQGLLSISVDYIQVFDEVSTTYTSILPAFRRST